jgi:hypothetical protein
MTGPGSLTVDALVVGPTQQDLVGPDAGSQGSFEAYIVVRGQAHVSVGPDGPVLHSGNVFLPRGRPHSLRTSDSEETRLVRVRCVADPMVDIAFPSTLRGSSGPSRRVRRVVAGADARGRPAIVQDGDPAVMFVLGDESDPDVGLTDVWELGGLVGNPEQGGDAADPWELKPRASGMKILNLELKPVESEGSPIAQIVNGTLGVGDRIPTESELCAAHGLARGTVRQALDQLERLGMINRQPKVGTVVVADLTGSP